MKYATYVRTDDTLRIDYTQRDADCNTIGRLEMAPDALAISGSLDDAIDAGYAYLGRHPDASICIADLDGNVYSTLICDDFHETRTSLQTEAFMAWACCTILFLGLFTTAGLGWLGVCLTVFATLLYVLMVKYGVFNEVESAAVCIILFVLMALLIPAVRQAYDVYLERSG